MKIIATFFFVFRTKFVDRRNVSVRVLERVWILVRLLEGDRVLRRDDVQPGGRGPLPEQGLEWSKYMRMSGEQVVGKSLTRVEKILVELTSTEFQHFFPIKTEDLLNTEFQHLKLDSTQHLVGL